MKVDHKVSKMTMKHVLWTITYTIFLILCVINWSAVTAFLGKLLSVISPVIIGIGFAFVFNLPMKYFERKLPSKIQSHRRLWSAICSGLLVVGILVFLINIIGPQIVDSVMMFKEELPNYIQRGQVIIDELVAALNISNANMVVIENYLTQLQSSFFSLLSDLLPRLLSIAGGVTAGIANTFLGLVMAIYMVASKDTLLRQCKALLKAFARTDIYDYVMYSAKLTNDAFSNFISGQLIEAFIIGVLCYIGCVILQIPYAPILGVFVGITNIIPIFGPIIGTVPGVILILLIDPIKAVIFVVFIIVLQQFEANIIYPRVVGNSVGLSGLWVLLGITIGGGFFGLLGIILGIPVVAVCYRLLSDEVKRRLDAKAPPCVVEE
ncbi:MAG: AI-2E family transporter [Erysipelotrichaceae bacterium]